MKRGLEFVNLKYKPKSTDLVCLFRVDAGNIKKASNIIALESSIGTWTDVSSDKKYVHELGARVFLIKGKNVKIAYPSKLFEKGNAPNILSSIAGNIFGMKAINSLRLEDISFPKNILNSFKGPKYGIKGIRKYTLIATRTGKDKQWLLLTALGQGKVPLFQLLFNGKSLTKISGLLILT